MTSEKDQEKHVEDLNRDLVKNYGLGFRHVQMLCMGICITVLFMARSSMAVAVLAMSDVKRKNDTNIVIYDWDPRTQNIILSSFFWGYTTLQIPAGILSKKFGGKIILLFALLANGVLCLLIPTLAALGGWPLVCMSRVAMGLTQACLFPASHTLLGQWLPPNEQTSYSGIVYGGVQIGTILSMPISGILADTSMGWKSIFYTMSGLQFAVAIIWYFFTASAPREHKFISKEERIYIESRLNIKDTGTKLRIPWRVILTSKPLLATLLPHLGFASAFMIVFVDMPMYMESALGISLKNSSVLSAFPYVGMWAAGFIAAIVSEKLCNTGILTRNACRKTFNSIGMFGVSTGLIILSFLGPRHATFAVIALIGAMTLGGFTMAGFIVNQLDLSPNNAGIIMSLSNFISNIGAVSMTLAASAIIGQDSTDVSRWRIVFLSNAVLCTAANVYYLIFGSTDRQEWDDPNYLDKKKADPEETKPFKMQEKKEEKLNMDKTI
ncbi:putative inorganic phosphate cotransporter [Galleria mellonella]|uniref:Inorganic phosphate cotransporter n=1 Tax=Galleria mellonella TaxID=7137 RepID=A0ABM3M870_GALME|nr:putative inorganic phosphate cotransporter [Galleria mellonella]